MRAILLCLMGLVILGQSELYSKNHPDTVQVLKLIEEANEFYEVGNREEAYNRAIEILDISEKLAYLNGKAFSNFILGLYYFDKSSFKNSIKYYDRALLFKIQLGDKIGIAELYNKRGIAYKNLGELQLAQNNYNQAIYIFNDIEHEYKEDKVFAKKKANLLSDIGVINRLLGNFETAIEYYINSIKIRKYINDAYGIGSCYANIANVYRELRQYDLMATNLLIANRYFKRLNNSFALEKVYTLLGDAYMSLEKFDSAEFFLKKSIKLNSTTKSTRNLVVTYSSVGDIYLLKDDFLTALRYYMDGYNVSKNEQFNTFIPPLCYSIAKVNFKQGNFDSSYKWISQGFDLSEKMGNQTLKLEGLFLFSEYFKYLNKYESAFNYLKSYYDLSNETRGAKVIQNVLSMENEYSNYQLSAQIDTLNNKVSTQKKSENISRIFIISLGGLCIILVIFIYNFRIRAQKRNLMIKELLNANDILKRSRPYIQDGKLAVRIV